ncbi:MAG TPA: MBL fold metallo-hydrolase [Acidobacteriaceae bacterium]|jgi:metallo-beta-lactamase family protein
MAIRLHFWGADQTVTGSSHHIECAGQNVLLDCGLFQGRRLDAAEINSHLALSPEQLAGGVLNAVVLSHAHIDHSGDLPLLAKQGYRGPIYTTPSTIDLCAAMLKDSAHIQEGDADFMNRKRNRRKSIGVAPGPEPVQPLYSQEDAEQVNQLFRPVKLHEPQVLAGSTKDAGFTMTSWNAGHMLGSTCVRMDAVENGQTVRLLFSGDVGRKNLPIIKDPDPAPPADYLIMESTYGDRLHPPAGDVKAKAAALVKATLARGGHVIVPAFAVERTQQLVLLLHEMVQAKEIADFPIFVDSPLASAVTDVFKKHTEDWDEGACAFYHKGVDAFGWNRLRYTKTVEESKGLNDLHVPYMVISASGMCEAGRILHHLKNGIEDPRNLILITGYQAANTLGSKLVAKLPEVNIFGEPLRVRAQIESIDSLSGHADQQELLDWMAPVAPTLKKVFLVHGELAAQEALKAKIVERYKLDVVIPKRGDRFEVA